MHQLMKRLSAAAITAVCVGGAGAARADILDGPYTAYFLTDSPDSGIQFTALESVNMTNFVFYNQGISDVIQFWDATENELVETLFTTEGYAEHFFRVDWDLTAGHTYWLVSLHPDNGRYARFSDFPVSNDHLRVDGAIDADRNLITNRWFSFRFLTTEAIPAPGALMLLTAAAARGARGGRRRQRIT